MKKTLCALAFFTATWAYTQVGINTPDPKATLDVQGVATDASTIDGVIPPRITKTQLTAKTGYGTAQTGAMVYITDATGASNTSTAKITEPGMHIFDGSAWFKANTQIVTTTTGSEVKKIQSVGLPDPLKTVVNGIFEFRMINNTQFQVRIAAPFVVTDIITLAMAHLWDIGTGDPGGGLSTITFNSSDHDQWKTFGSITNVSRSRMTYMSVNGTDITSPMFYVLFAKGSNDTSVGVRSLIITRY